MKKDEVLMLIKDAVCEVLPNLLEYEFNKNDSLESLGANSMDRADIVMMVTERMNLRIPLMETVGPNNIDELARLLSEKSN